MLYLSGYIAQCRQNVQDIQGPRARSVTRHSSLVTGCFALLSAHQTYDPAQGSTVIRVSELRDSEAALIV
jgi:hypothetical protein